MTCFSALENAPNDVMADSLPEDCAKWLPCKYLQLAVLNNMVGFGLLLVTNVCNSGCSRSLTDVLPYWS